MLNFNIKAAVFWIGVVAIIVSQTIAIPVPNMNGWLLLAAGIAETCLGIDLMAANAREFRSRPLHDHIRSGLLPVVVGFVATGLLIFGKLPASGFPI